MPRAHENDIILQIYTRTPAPCRDYCGLTLTKDEVILNIWRVTFGPHVYPRRQRHELTDFLEDKRAQSDIENLFGQNICTYVTSIAKNEVNLQNLPTKLFHYLLNYLAAKDIFMLSQTSRVLFERCNSSSVWKIIFKKKLDRKLDSRDILLANQCGWKEYLKSKLILQPRNKNNISIKPLNNTSKNNTSKTDTKKSKASLKQVKNDISKKEVNVKPLKPSTGINTTKILPSKNNSSVANLKIKSKSAIAVMNKK